MIEVYYPDWQWAYSWILYLGFGFCFLVAFGMGANDCANSYATVVGARVLKLWQAYILATIFEITGAGLLGYKVTSTMTKSVVDVDIYSAYSERLPNGTFINVNSSCLSIPNSTCTEYTQVEFGIGELSALISTSSWLIFATVLRLPVSTTQSAVGATVGFSLVDKGPAGIHWREIIGIVISWVASPILAGLFAVSIYVVVKYSVLKQEKQFEAALRMMPFFFLFALTVNIFAVTFDGTKYLGFDKLTWYECFAISLGVGIIVALLCWFYARHWVKRRVEALQSSGRLSAQIKEDDDPKKIVVELVDKPTNPDVEILKRDSVIREKGFFKRMSVETILTLKKFKEPIEEQPMATEVFHYLQIMSACFISFSHGSNDTANCVGSLVGIWLLFKDNYVGVDSTNNPALEYLILFGAVSMVIGLWCLGHKVIKTMGENICQVTAPSGFCMELGTAFTVLFASKLGIPVSTTHCAVGAIVAVGWFKSHEGGVSWKLFKNIAIAWLVTVPVAGCVSALIAYLLNFTVQ